VGRAGQLVARTRHMESTANICAAEGYFAMRRRGVTVRIGVSAAGPGPRRWDRGAIKLGQSPLVPRRLRTHIVCFLLLIYRLRAKPGIPGVAQRLEAGC